MLQQAALAGPPPPLHTTSDLLRLLAADAHPFAAVAEAVAARFGGSAESQAWLARTLVTLLRVRAQGNSPADAGCRSPCPDVQRSRATTPLVRNPGCRRVRPTCPFTHPTPALSHQDGLLYTEAEKMNAAYLLRFAAPGAAGSREALFHLALPDGGEPPAVRAWAAALAQPLPGEAQASGSSMGSAGSAGSSPLGSPSWQQQQQAHAAGLAAAALLHQRTPRQVLAEAAAPQVQLGQLPFGASTSQLPWQATVSLAAAAAAPPPPAFDAPPAVGSPSLAPSLPPWLQPQQPLSPASAHHAASPLAAQAQELAASFSPHALSPASSFPLPMPGAQSPPQLSLQQLPPPLQPLEPQPAASASFAALQLQQQPQVPPLLQQQREQEELDGLQALLQQAAQAALVPAKRQQLVAALGGPLAPRLTAPLAAAVSGGGGSGGLQPHHMRGLVEQNCPVASQVRLLLTP